MRIKKTVWLCLLVLLLLAGAVVWAGGQKDSGEASMEGAESKWNGTIRMWSNGFLPNIDRGPNLPMLTKLGELADEYVKLYPGVKIEWVERPAGDEHYTAWLVTQITGGTVPEIVYGHGSELEQYAPEGWFVDWMPYLQEPNPYIQGNKVWYDTFGKKLVELRRSSDGALWSLPVCMVATIIYYNKDIFSEVGVTVPDTWSEFMDMQKKIKDGGHTPLLFDLSKSTNLSWSYRIFISHFYEDLMKEIDVLGSPDVVAAEEFARAVKKGIIAGNDPQHKASLDMYPEWSQYWQKGYLMKPQPGVFERGETAMYWGHINRMVPLLNDPLRKFELGTLYAPQVTKATSPYSTEKPMRMVGGASGEQWAISKSAIDNGLVDLSVDFIRFLTVPDNINGILAEAKTSAPLILGGKLPPELEPFMPQAEAGVSPFIVERFLSTKQRDTWFREFQLFMSEKYTLDEFADKIAKLWEEAADELIGKHGYDQSKW